MAMRQLVGSQHALSPQTRIAIRETVMSTKLADMHALKEQPIKGAISLLI
jgi:hypothetical protein